MATVPALPCPLSPSLFGHGPRYIFLRCPGPRWPPYQLYHTHCPSVVCDKGLPEISKKVCVVNAADYSYLWSVRGDSVTQTLVGYKNLKTSLPSDVHVRRTFHGELRCNTPRNVRQTLPQATTGTDLTCPHGAHSRSSSSPTIS